MHSVLCDGMVKLSFNDELVFGMHRLEIINIDAALAAIIEIIKK